MHPEKVTLLDMRCSPCFLLFNIRSLLFLSPHLILNAQAARSDCVTTTTGRAFTHGHAHAPG